MARRVVYVAPQARHTGPPALHLPHLDRRGLTRCGKPYTPAWTLELAEPDDRRMCRYCTRSER